jgi:hypothetical protein
MKSMSTAKLLPVMWNDLDDLPEDRPRNIEEQVTLRRMNKRLEDCTLPEEFRLVTARPKQFWIDHQLVWGFKLAWARVDGQGRRGVEEFAHVAQYDARIADEVQMRWALDDFSRDLAMQQTREHAVPLVFSMRLAS